MDNPSPESTSLDVNQAASLFANAFDPPKEVDSDPVDTELDLKEPEKEPEQKSEPEAEAPDDSSDVVTVKIDGKDVQLTQEQIAEAYKNGLRQADYTKKTMEAAEVKKSAQVEIDTARQERNQYAANLDRMAAQLDGVMQAAANVDMNALLESDPVEYLKQTHLFNQRQAQLNQVNQQRQQIAAQTQAEQAEAQRTYIQTQQQELLAKLPAWKDAAKASAERDALKSYLKAEGYDDASIAGISDHRAVILARKSMLYDQMISKASAAAKKVATLPQKVERPGVADSPQMDKRGAAYQRLSKSGRIEDAAALFSSIL